MKCYPVETIREHIFGQLEKSIMKISTILQKSLIQKDLFFQINNLIQKRTKRKPTKRTFVSQFTANETALKINVDFIIAMAKELKRPCAIHELLNIRHVFVFND